MEGYSKPNLIGRKRDLKKKKKKRRTLRREGHTTTYYSKIYRDRKTKKLRYFSEREKKLKEVIDFLSKKRRGRVYPFLGLSKEAFVRRQNAWKEE